MADFGFLSDTDESAVEELISQAQDLCVLEQVSAINCSSFTDSVLPTDLESRFRRLKSFPVAKAAPNSSGNSSDSKALRQSKSELGKSESFWQHGGSINFSPSKQRPYGNTALEKKREKGKTESSAFSDEEGGISPVSKENPAGEKGLKGKNRHGSVSSRSNSSDSCLENADFSPPKQSPKARDRSGSKRKPKSRSFSSPLGSSFSSWLESPSPPHKSGCFWCSPKKVSKKKSKETKVIGGDLDWEKCDEFLSDLSGFSVQEQRKILKKAMKEQQKLSREAAKIVKQAKQASSRMSFQGIGDESSDD